MTGHTLFIVVACLFELFSPVLYIIILSAFYKHVAKAAWTYPSKGTIRYHRRVVG